MNTEEFLELMANSQLGKQEAASLLGVSRGTINNWENGEKIPSTKTEFIRRNLSKDPRILKLFLSKSDGLSTDLVMDFVLRNFDVFLENQDFRDKVYAQAYSLASEIIEQKLKENQ
ncbi:helix-turn-helix domain-containing protein [Muricauda sp. 2012CJ35-5]|uniref:Helix-turn-helix domain-containing protein n=1 Tax=Flagellimonas spongiicola TaxID=2942208 RepID=A0ABT0PTL7_9FLAO|nr:helix-turn-helix transcriptional regulator [Allomuricauda spongiicola]MCL6274742.1 helix-turn-helix domain-containing protein [Allomuricauda spongiicola]